MFHHYPTLGDASGPDTKELQSSRRLPKFEPTSEADLSRSRKFKGARTSRHAKGTGASYQATDSGKAEGKAIELGQRLPDRKGWKQHIKYEIIENDAEPSDSLRPLVRISSHRVDLPKLKATTLEEFKKRLAKVYPNKATLIQGLRYKPPPMFDRKENLIDNGKTIAQMRRFLVRPFSKDMQQKRQRQADRKSRLGTLQGLGRKMAADYHTGGYAIVFAKHASRGPDEPLYYTVIGRKGDDNTGKKVWVGDIEVPRSIWGSNERLQPVV